MSLVKANGAGEVSTGFYNGVIGQSLRFDSASSSYLQDTASGTPSSTTNRAVSFWVKRSKLSTTQILLNGQVSGPNVTDFINFRSDDTIMIYVDLTAGGSDETQWQTTAKFRDTASWYHIFVKYTLSESSNADKVKLYVNGNLTPLTATQTGNAVTSSRLLTNGTVIKISNYFDNRYYLDGYLAEYNVIDGDADHTDFGETKNGVWIAKAYSGSYGNSGFRLTFEAAGTSTTADGTDNSSNMTNIGDDKSGNGNNFAVYNLVGDDRFPDTPENNFPTFNFLDLRNNASLSQGATQLDATTYSGGNYGQCALTIPVPPSGKWYIECHIESSGSSGGNLMCFGVVDRDDMTVSAAASNYYNTTGLGFTGQVNQLYLTGTLNYYYNVSDGSYSGYNVDRSFTSQEAIIAMAIDVDNGYIYFGRDAGTGNTGSQITWRKPSDGTTGTSNVNPESGSSGTGGIARTFNNNTVIIVDVSVDGGNVYKIRSTINAGQDSSFAGKVTAQNETDGNGQGDFYYSVPSGYLALCSANLPDTGFNADESNQPTSFHNVVTYSGTGNTTQNITGVGFQPDWVWIKNTNTTVNHYVLDSTRGLNALSSNTTSAQSSSANRFNSFDSDGFQVEHSGGGNGFTNGSGQDYVAWNWKINGGTTTTDTTGTQDSIIQTNQTLGMTIGVHEATSGTYTFAHGLGATPEFLMLRNIDGTDNWPYWHTGMGAAGQSLMYINSSTARSASGGSWLSTLNSSLIGITTLQVTGTSGTHLFWAFRSIEGFSKFGKYEGNASTDGPFIYTGFRPSLIWIKNYDTGTTDHHIYDDERDKSSNSSNPRELHLITNSTDDNQDLYDVDFLSNGFKIRHGDVNNINAGDTYLYWAWAHNPFKFSNAF